MLPKTSPFSLGLCLRSSGRFSGMCRTATHTSVPSPFAAGNSATGYSRVRIFAAHRAARGASPPAIPTPPCAYRSPLLHPFLTLRDFYPHAGGAGGGRRALSFPCCATPRCYFHFAATFFLLLPGWFGTVSPFTARRAALRAAAVLMRKKQTLRWRALQTSSRLVKGGGVKAGDRTMPHALPCYPCQHLYSMRACVLDDWCVLAQTASGVARQGRAARRSALGESARAAAHLPLPSSL